MKKISSLLMAFALGAILVSCNDVNEVAPAQNEVPNAVVAQLAGMGFNTSDFGVIATDGGYIVENDIFVSTADLADGIPVGAESVTEEHYRTTNLVTGLPRVINVYLPLSGRGSYSSAEAAALDLAISRYNALNMDLSFARVSSSNGADIVFTRLKKGDERRGVLGSAGFPTSNGDPYGEIKMSGILISSYGLSTGGVATIFGHEMGHCIGLRHTDFMDRSYSCGGSPTNEGASTVGAIHIPGTPTSPEAGSFMLSCTDGSDRPFTSGDRTALTTLY